MKPGTIINKIITQLDSHNEIIKNLLQELEESLEKENTKLKEDICKKIAASFELDTAQVLKKIIRKKNTTLISPTKPNDAVECLEIIEDVEDNKDYVPVYKKIIYEDKEYYYDDKPNGIVIQTDAESSNTKIVGYIDNVSKIIKFI